ncbi:hypothetical protein Tco_0226425 [Tanacetum coccineum]
MLSSGIGSTLLGLEALPEFVPKGGGIGNGYSRKRAKRKPKTNKSKHGVERAKAKVIKLKKIQREGLKLPKPQVVLQKRKARVKIAKKVEIAFKLYNLRGPFLPTPQKVFFPAPKNPVTTGRKAYLLGDKQIPSVGVFDEV